VGRVVGGGFRSCSMCVLERRELGGKTGGGVCVMWCVVETLFCSCVGVERCEGEFGLDLFDDVIDGFSACLCCQGLTIPIYILSTMDNT
jgi:hypothetical protein